MIQKHRERFGGLFAFLIGLLAIAGFVIFVYLGYWIGTLIDLASKVN